MGKKSNVCMYNKVSPAVKDILSYIYIDLAVIESTIDASVELPLEDRNTILKCTNNIQDILGELYI